MRHNWIPLAFDGNLENLACKTLQFENTTTNYFPTMDMMAVLASFPPNVPTLHFSDISALGKYHVQTLPDSFGGISMAKDDSDS